MRAQMIVTFVVISFLKINTTEGKNMTTKAFSTCLKETYKSMSRSISCSAGYCHSLLIGRTSPSHTYNTNCRNQCPGCFKAILRMLTYKEKQMAATTTPQTLAVTNAPITKPLIKATTMQLVIEATNNKQVADLNTPACQREGTDSTSTSTWNHGITALIVVLAVLAVLAIVAIVIICIFRRDLISRCKLSRLSKRHPSKSGNLSSNKHASSNPSYTPVDSQTGEDMGRVEEPRSSDTLLQMPNDRPHSSVTNGEVQRVANDPPPQTTSDGMDSLTTPKSICLPTAPSSMVLQTSTLAIASPMTSNGTAPHQPPPHQVNGRVAPSETPPGALNGAVPQTAPNRAPNGAVPQTAPKGAPNGAVPQTAPKGAPNGAVPQTAPKGAPNGAVPQTAPKGAPNGAVPQTAPIGAPNGAAPQTAPNGAPNGAVPQTGPNGAPNGAVPHTRSGAPPQEGQCRGVPQAGPTGALPKTGPSNAPPLLATTGNNVNQTVGTGGNLHNMTANNITIYNFNNPDSHQHRVKYVALALPNTESPVQQNNEDHFSVAKEEEGELTVPDEAGDREGSHKLSFIER